MRLRLWNGVRKDIRARWPLYWDDIRAGRDWKVRLRSAAVATFTASP